MVKTLLCLIACLAQVAGAAGMDAGRAWAARMAVAEPLGVAATFDTHGRLWLARVVDRRVLVSWSDNEGATFSQPVPVNPVPEAVAAEGENRPKLAVSTDGTVHVAWTVSLAKPYSGHVRYSRSRDGGRGFSPPIDVNDDKAEIGHRFEALAVEGDRVALAWLDARDRRAAEATGLPYAGASLYYALSNDGGASFEANRRLAEHTCECCRVGLAWSGGAPMALWRHLFPGGARDFALAALTEGAEIRRASDDDWALAGCPHHGGALSADARGALHLVWYTQGKTRQGLFYRRLDDAGLSPPLRFGADDAQAGHATVLAEGDKVGVAWREFDGRAYGVWFMSSPDRGATWSQPARVAQSAGGADYPQLLAKAGALWLAWNTQADGFLIRPLAGVGT